MRPVVVCPEMSSPAQSLASVMNVPSNSCFPCLAAFCSFCLGSLGPYSASFRQQRKAKALHIRTIRRPARKVHMLDRRKHQYFLSERQSSGLMEVAFEGPVAASSLAIPRSALPSSVEASTLHRSLPIKSHQRKERRAPATQHSQTCWWGLPGGDGFTCASVSRCGNQYWPPR